MDFPMWHSNGAPASARTCGPHAFKRRKMVLTSPEHYTAHLYAKFESSPALDLDRPIVSVTGSEVIASPSEKESSRGLPGPKTCAQCKTTRTPLWRNGPPGPKSLCNACGIRFNKLKAGKRCRSIAGADSSFDLECTTPTSFPPIVRTVSGRRSRPSEKRLLTVKDRKPSGLSHLWSEDSSSGDSCVTRKGKRSPPTSVGAAPRRPEMGNEDVAKESEDEDQAGLVDDGTAAGMLMSLLEGEWN